MKLVLDDGTEYAIGFVRDMNLSTPGEIWQLYPKPGVPQTEEAGQTGAINYGLDSLELSIHMAVMPSDARRAFMQKVVLEEVSRRNIMDKPVIEQKPTLEQIRWVLLCLMQSWNDGGSYRHLLEVMGVDGQPGAYEKLLPGLEINNCLYEDWERKHGEELRRRMFIKHDLPLHEKKP